jgi:REP element-mobilizing transposase RayT
MDDGTNAGGRLPPLRQTRKHVRLQDYDYGQNGAYFVTLCAKNRHNYFGKIIVGAATCRPQNEYTGELHIQAASSGGRLPPLHPQNEYSGVYVALSEYGKIVDDAIRKIHNVYNHVCIGRYVIMPNHVHLILNVGENDEVLNDGRQVAAPTVSSIIGNMKRIVSKRTGFSIWQKSFYDHIIRDDEDYNRIAEYIKDNPEKWAEDQYFMP